MSVISVTTDMWALNREKSLALLDRIDETGESQAILGWRPGPGRAHIAWQLMHIGVTEELFATERILGTKASFEDVVPRFRGGSTPDDDPPVSEAIRDLLASSREHLLETIEQFSDSDLKTIPKPMQERGWSLGHILKILNWHEPHHQGQAHITLNLWLAAHG